MEGLFLLKKTKVEKKSLHFRKKFYKFVSTVCLIYLKEQKICLRSFVIRFLYY